MFAFNGETKLVSAGFDLKEGNYIDRPLSDDEMWSVFSYLFSSKSVNDTSYKFGFLKSILDNLYNVDETLTLNFDMLFSKFAEIYWNFVLACPSCNNKKRDKLADQMYLDRLEKRNSILIDRQQVDKRIQINRVRSIYGWAIRNGYNEIWTPNTKTVG